MNIKDVENLAELAKLELSSAEKESLLHDMGGILDYVKQIESVEVGDIKVEHEIYNVWREDVAEPENPPEAGKFSRESIVEQFPNQQPARTTDVVQSGGDGIFLKVKKIL